MLPLNSSGQSGRHVLLRGHQELWSNRRLRVVRADRGFCTGKLLALWEALTLRFIVAAKLTEPVRRLVRSFRHLECCSTWHEPRPVYARTILCKFLQTVSNPYKLRDSAGWCLQEKII